MATTHSYACRDYPGMESCPARFTTETQDELMKIVELHAAVAHGEDPAAWTDEDRAQVKSLIRTG